MCGRDEDEKVILGNGDEIETGDRIRIKSKEELEALMDTEDISDEMLEFAGKEAEVTYIYSDDDMELDIDGQEYYWSPAMIAEKVEV